MPEQLQGKLRIIGGKWRSRKLIFPSLPELRPTPDRIRETLFNWLAPYVPDSNCLDLFAGSGALGFEALSRGAAHVTFVDHSKPVIDALQKNATLLNATNVEFIQGECPAHLPLKDAPFDIIFLDPPFHKGLVQKAAVWLEENEIMSEKAIIYVETEKDLKPLSVPNNWKPHREKQTSSLSYYLFMRQLVGDK